MKKILIITSKFNIMTGVRNTLYIKNEVQRTTVEWIDSRIDIFMNYTVKSLVKQTNQNFYAIYAYEDNTEEVLRKSLNRYESLPNNIKLVKKSEYNGVINNLTQGYDILYLTRLDSDDMYIEDFVDKIYNYNIEDDVEVILCRDGYVYDSNNNKLAEYSHNSFVFYTFIYRLYKEKMKYDSLPITPWDLLINFFHFEVVKYNFEVLSGRNYIFHIHEKNTDSKFPTASFIFYTLGRELKEAEEKKNILIRFFL